MKELAREAAKSMIKTAHSCSSRVPNLHKVICSISITLASCLSFYTQADATLLSSSIVQQNIIEAFVADKSVNFDDFNLQLSSSNLALHKINDNISIVPDSGTGTVLPTLPLPALDVVTTSDSGTDTVHPIADFVLDDAALALATVPDSGTGTISETQGLLIVNDPSQPLGLGVSVSEPSSFSVILFALICLILVSRKRKAVTC
jgi:hypothetical protein